MILHRVIYTYIRTVPLLLVLLFGISIVACTHYQVPEGFDVGVQGQDSDKDGVTDDMEVALGIDPNNPDSDSDGLMDGMELEMRLDPRNADTDQDGILDADDSLPNIDNNRLFLYIGTVIAVLTIASLIWFHLKVGFTKDRKDELIQKKQRNKDEDMLFVQVKYTILEMAKQKYGWLGTSEVASKLAIDPDLVVRFYTKLKAKRDGQYYRFPEIEKTFSKG